jgi:NADH-quinone oxidoreductase subunit F
MLADRDRVFTNLYGDGDWRLAGARRRGDWDGTREVILKGRDWIVNEVKESGLRGRGGAGFPTGLKWSFMTKESDRPCYIVVNADERTWHLQGPRHPAQRPAQIARGCLLAGVGGDGRRLHLYPREFYNEAQHLQAAIEEAYVGRPDRQERLRLGHDYDIYLHRGWRLTSAARRPGCSEAFEARRSAAPSKPALSGSRRPYGCPPPSTMSRRLRPRRQS